MTPEAFSLADDLIKQVQTRMIEIKMSKRALADAMDVTPGYISHLFLGRKRNMTLETMVKLARAVGLGIEVTMYESASHD